MRFFLLALALAAPGCMVLRYDHEPVPCAGSIWVAHPVILNTHTELNKVPASNDIRAAAVEALRKEGFTIAAEEAEADVVLQAEIQDLWLGSEAVRLLAWRAERMDVEEPWHRTKLTIRPKGMQGNGTSWTDHVDSGGFTRKDAEWVRMRALTASIAGFYVRVAKDFRK